MHYAEYACHSRPGSFPFKCEPESIKRNELRKPGYYLSVYPLRLFHTIPGVNGLQERWMHGENIYSLAAKLVYVKDGCGTFRFDHYK